MTKPDYMNGEWHDWHGGDCPVLGDTRVEIQFRCGERNDSHTAKGWGWPDTGGNYSITRFRVILDKTTTPTPNKYARTIRSETVDVYDVLHAFNVTDHATAHAVKKLLMAGQRGHKDKITDLREAIASVERQIQMEEGK